MYEESPPQFFGPPWGASYLDGAVRVSLPDGARCLWCQQDLTAADQGMLIRNLERDPTGGWHLPRRPWHRECMVVSPTYGWESDQDSSRSQSSGQMLPVW